MAAYVAFHRISLPVPHAKSHKLFLPLIKRSSLFVLDERDCGPLDTPFPSDPIDVVHERRRKEFHALAGCVGGAEEESAGR